MQSQRVQQRAITANQSLQVVQTLLRAGFGCVAYLRGLLPDENFTEAHLTSSGNPSLSQPESQENDAVFEKRRPPTNSVRLKTIKKGWSTEGDKLLEYLEEGIFDALEKQYLRSFIFAVYLDDKDPENIIEAYTFNFSYHTVPGSSSKVPIMTLGEKMNKMSLNTRSTSKMDPAAEAIVKGKPPTLGDVKQSVKNLVRSLIAAIQTLNGLPKRRFATFKLFYMDHVPEHYEPPHFTAGNPDNRYFFTTHSTKEMPEKMSIGSLTTPYHGLDMHIASVSDLIPHCGNNDDARFGNLVDHEGSSYSATQTMTVADRGQSIEAQQQDALLRKVVWDAEALANPNIDADAEGEDDPEYGEKMSQQPIGVRLPDGTVIEMSVSDNGIEKSQVSYLGMIEDEPNTIKNTHIPVNADNIATQVVEPTPPDSPLTEPPPSPGNVTGSQLKDHEDSLMSTGIETQALRNIISQADAKEDLACLNGIQDLEMLDLETQQPSDGHLLDEIQSFVSQRTRSQDDQIMKPVSLETPAKNTSHRTSIAADNPDLVEDCDCGVNEDEDYGACQCEGACGRWLHVWCMGYHSVHDPRLPEVFLCFGCRLRNDPQIEVLNSRNLTSEYITKFKDLSLFRRALKIVEVYRPENVTRFKELLGSEVSTAGQTWKRLESEGFIALQATETDSIGIRKGKGKQKTGKSIKRAKYLPVPEAIVGKGYQDYFQPAKEGTLLGLVKLKHITSRQFKPQTMFKVPALPQAQESQTQLEETQLCAKDETASSSLSAKRKAVEEETSNTMFKRVKTSIGLGIDLED